MFLEIEETRIHWFNAQSEDYQDFDLIGKLKHFFQKKKKKKKKG